jgi:golgin subfamily B member 1
MPVDLLSYTGEAQPSMNPHFRQLGQSELLPRYIFAEGLIARRRVLEVGAVAATGGRSAQFLLQRGARSVVACDAEVAAIEQAQQELGTPQLRFRADTFEEFAPGEFDLVLVADLAPYVRAPELLKELVRLLAGHGHLIGGLRNPSGLALCQLVEPEGAEAPPTFGQLLDALSPHFRSVEVATQSPVVGYQLAFEGAEGLLVDGTLVNQVEAAYFVVLAGQEPARSLDPSWIQLPPEPLAFAAECLERASERARDADERAGRLKKLLEEARDDAEARSAQSSKFERELQTEREISAQLQARLEAFERGAGERVELDQLAMRLKQLEAELAVERQRVEEGERQVAAYQSEMEAVRAAGLEAKEQHLALEQVIEQERARREELAAAHQQGQERVATLVEQLKELGAVNNSLRAELEKSGHAVGSELEALSARNRDLEAELEQLRAQVESREAEVRAKLESAQLLESQLEEMRKKLDEEQLTGNEQRRQEATRTQEELVAAQAASSRATAELGELETKMQAALNEASERSYRLQAENERLSRQLSEQQRGAHEALARAASEEEKLRSSLDWAESERARLAEELQKAAGTSARDGELSAAIADRDARLQILQRRLAAQSAELSALRSSVGRSVPQQVEQIYQRASAELSAVKAEIRRSASIPTEKPLEDPPVANPPATPLEPGGKAKKP